MYSRYWLSDVKVTKKSQYGISGNRKNYKEVKKLQGTQWFSLREKMEEHLKVNIFVFDFCLCVHGVCSHFVLGDTLTES